MNQYSNFIPPNKPYDINPDISAGRIHVTSINPNGDFLGIGTQTPESMLTIDSTNTSTYPGIVGKTSSYQLFRLEQWYGNEGFLGLYADGNLKVKLTGGEGTDKPSYINNGQNFGIGVSDPDNALEVNGDISTSTTNQAIMARYSNQNAYAALLGWSSGADGCILQLGNNNANNEIRAGHTGTGGGLKIITNNTADYTATHNGTVALAFTSAGNATFAGDVEINGSSLTVDSTGNAILYMDGGEANYSGLWFGQLGSKRWEIVNHPTADKLYFNSTTIESFVA